jgi:hypothetical protein
MQIARRHLISKQIAYHGLRENQLEITDNALGRLIEEYTREAGVRALERMVARVARKGARNLVDQYSAEIKKAAEAIAATEDEERALETLTDETNAEELADAGAAEKMDAALDKLKAVDLADDGDEEDTCEDDDLSSEFDMDIIEDFNLILAPMNGACLWRARVIGRMSPSEQFQRAGLRLLLHLAANDRPETDVPKIQHSLVLSMHQHL